MIRKVREVINEKGFIKKNWRNRVPVCIVYPDSYFVGMSNLALHLLYCTLNGIEDIVCERAFFEKGSESFSLESKRTLSSFEILFFTFSYELNYINVASILKNSGIPLLRKERNDKEPIPIIVAGGITVIANPEPISDFFDLFIMGDVEATIHEFMDSYLQAREKARGKILEELSKFPWVYNPSFLKINYRDDGKVSSFEPSDFKVKVNYYRGEPLGRSVILSTDTEFANMYLVEGTRGCPSRCPFCLMGNVYDFRVDEKSIYEAAEKNIDDIGLLGGGVSFLNTLPRIIGYLSDRGKNLHLPSLRIDKIPYELLEVIKDRVKTLTFGIEAGSFRLRRAIGKPISDEEIISNIEKIFNIAGFNLKLYFMIGLPDEKMEDIEAIFELAKKIRHVAVKKMAPRGFMSRLTIHISPFVPKPGTPLQWTRMDNLDSLEEKTKWLRSKIKKLGSLIFTHESIKYSFIQAILARGDRRLGFVVQKLAEGDNLRKIMLESPVNLGFYVYRERERDEIFPWDFIEGTRSKEDLYKAFEIFLSKLKNE
ncbi:MAG: B12-binding domain-containing radical SAM protein [Deltaproteobacteria bacterium]|nr:B12-binding domain-containing radical SAM protein [Deltaproteobacteria bacterium]